MLLRALVYCFFVIVFTLLFLFDIVNNLFFGFVVVIVYQLADVGCAVHLCCLLHQRYEDFSSSLMDNLQRIYQNPIAKDDDKVRTYIVVDVALRG